MIADKNYLFYGYYWGLALELFVWLRDIFWNVYGDLSWMELLDITWCSCTPMRLWLRDITLLPPTNEVCEGYVFTPVCQSFCSQGGLPQYMLGYTPPRSRPPPEQTPPPPRSRYPLEADTPQSSACWEIWVTSGQYASYWSAYLSSNASTLLESYLQKSTLSLIIWFCQ